MGNLLAYTAFVLFMNLFRVLPFRLMYILSDGVSWLLLKVIKYRTRVVQQNLAISGINADTADRGQLMSNIYTNLSDVLLEGIKSMGMTKDDVLKRHRVVNPELANQYFKQGRSVILVTGHIGNWEWGSLSASLYTSFQVIGFYKPLTNKLIDKLIMKSRSKSGTVLAPIAETTSTFQKHKNDPALFLMAADQCPVNTSQAHIVDFLGRPTYFLHGPEKHARANNLPVVYADILRRKRGFYEVSLTEISNNPSDLDEGEITRRYAQQVEESILRNPQSWLWTHRRWKRQPPAV